MVYTSGIDVYMCAKGIVAQQKSYEFLNFEKLEARNTPITIVNINQEHQTEA